MIKVDISDQTNEVQALKSDIDIIASDVANLKSIISTSSDLNIQLSNQIGNIDVQLDRNSEEVTQI